MVLSVWRQSAAHEQVQIETQAGQVQAAGQLIAFAFGQVEADCLETRPDHRIAYIEQANYIPTSLGHAIEPTYKRVEIGQVQDHRNVPEIQFNFSATAALSEQQAGFFNQDAVRWVRNSLHNNQSV